MPILISHRACLVGPVDLVIAVSTRRASNEPRVRASSGTGCYINANERKDRCHLPIEDRHRSEIFIGAFSTRMLGLWIRGSKSVRHAVNDSSDPAASCRLAVAGAKLLNPQAQKGVLLPR